MAEERTPRARLALAIENYRSTAKHVADLERGRDLALDRRLEARRQRDHAQAALNHANREEARQLVSDLLDTSATTQPVTDHEAALSRAEAQYSQSVRTAEAIEEALEKALRDMRWAAVQLDEAVSVVAANSPAVAALIAELQEARRRVFGFEAVLDLLRSKNALTPQQRAATAMPEADPAPRALWQAALTALAENAAALLPGECDAVRR